MAKPKQPSAKYKLTLSVDKDFARRFAGYAAVTGQDMSLIAMRAVRTEMKGFTYRLPSDADGQADATEGSSVRLARSENQREAG